jgi:putative iron-dependent peroxidase
VPEGPTPQPGVLSPVPSAARFLTFILRPYGDPREVLEGLRESLWDPCVVLGVGAPGLNVPGLRPMPLSLRRFAYTQASLFARVSHSDESDRFDACMALARRLEGAFAVAEEVHAFLYAEGRDLSGFEDGTENPTGARALDAAVVQAGPLGVRGGSFALVQRWVHDLAALEALGREGRNRVIGRDRDTNQELPNAPPSAHIRRTAQEDFDPPAFMLRRSMPYGGVREHGLQFLAFGASLDRFERMLARMNGDEDGVPDALFTFSSAATSGYYFCPPLREGRIDLRAVTGR